MLKLELLDRITRTERKLSRLLPKTTTPSTPKLSSEIHKTWKELCEFSQCRLEAFGTRKNQIACEARGEHADFADPRYFHNSNRRVGIFLEKIVSPKIKEIPDWLRKGKESLAVVVDVAVDEFKPVHGDKIFSPEYLTEAVDATEYCIKNFNAPESL